MSQNLQHHYVCPDPECPVVVFVDTMLNDQVDASTQGFCPNYDQHPGLDDGRGVLIEKTF